MNKEKVAKWLRQLHSARDFQGFHALRTRMLLPNGAVYAYCPLGIGVLNGLRQEWKVDPTYSPIVEPYVDSASFQTRYELFKHDLDLSLTQVNHVVYLNDECHYSFRQIADILSKEWDVAI